MQFLTEKTIGVDGRIVIPDVARHSYGFIPGKDVLIYIDGDQLVLRPSERYASCCICRGTHDDCELLQIDGTYICERCRERLCK